MTKGYAYYDLILSQETAFKNHFNTKYMRHARLHYKLGKIKKRITLVFSARIINLVPHETAPPFFRRQIS